MARDTTCCSDFALDRALAGELEGEEAERCRSHLGTCARCATRLRELEEERGRFAREAPPLVLPRRRARPRFAGWAWASGALAAAAALLLVLRSGPPRESGTRAKGDGDRLGLFVRHDGVVRKGGAGERVVPGDSLRFAYSARVPRYVAVLSRDGAGKASVYFPSSGPEAARVEPGVEAPLPESTVLDETLGAEDLYGVFCAAPFPLEPMRAALEASPGPPRVPDGCTVDALRLSKELSPPR